MLKNNKGFMLIEVIVTSTIVLTSMIALYVSFNKLYTNYNVKNSYYNIDATYATKKIIDSMIKENSINKILNEEPNYIYIMKNEDNVVRCSENLSINCDKIKEFYQINNMIFLKYDFIDSLINIEKENLNETFKDYINYLIKYYNLDEENNIDMYDYIVITEVKQKNEYFYSNLRVR